MLETQKCRTESCVNNLFIISTSGLDGAVLDNKWVCWSGDNPAFTHDHRLGVENNRIYLQLVSAEMHLCGRCNLIDGGRSSDILETLRVEPPVLGAYREGVCVCLCVCVSVCARCDWGSCHLLNKWWCPHSAAPHPFLMLCLCCKSSKSIFLRHPTLLQVCISFVLSFIHSLEAHSIKSMVFIHINVANFSSHFGANF